MHQRAAAVTALGALERPQGEDPVGAHVLAVAQVHHAGLALGHIPDETMPGG